MITAATPAPAQTTPEPPQELELIESLRARASALAEAVANARAACNLRLSEIDAAEIQNGERIKEESSQHLAAIQLKYQGERERLFADLRSIEEQSGAAGMAWDASFWENYQPPSQPPHAVTLGRLLVPLGKAWIDTPAFLPFRSGRSVLIKAGGNAKQQAIEGLRSFVLRLLTLVPPGKLRLLLLDPLGLGHNLAEFMHLSDDFPELVSNKVWVEQRDIEKQLGDLSEHMGMVIQSYLRGRYKSIEEYNDEANEVREPYRLLVAINFPVNFSDEAARRLTSIAAKGPACGVFTAVMQDTEQPLPREFNPEELERSSTVIQWSKDHFTWPYFAATGSYLKLDSPPETERFEMLVRSVGAAAKAAAQVKLPAEKVLLERRSWWAANSTAGLQVTIGRAGARRLQQLTLGQGTAHHVLVAGRTGSGKSVLMHMLVTSMALTYSPEELEMYLVDLKSGVEFKDYASYRLPHARVIAIASEREFGLSVLEKLESEMRQRGDVFREAQCSNIEQYRECKSEKGNRERHRLLPRILLIIDEFQQLFVPPEDTIAHRAALFLDQLVRQGRSFGIHVILVSQTLRGAYTLHRDTMGQMAVRIALQCEADDSRVILSEDNPAARLLSHPGDAIYNPLDGREEGNSRFQVAWLSEEQRREYLAEMGQMAQDRQVRLMTVFDGTSAARVHDNPAHPLQKLIATAPPRQSSLRADDNCTSLI